MRPSSLRHTKTRVDAKASKRRFFGSIYLKSPVALPSLPYWHCSRFCEMESLALYGSDEEEEVVGEKSALSVGLGRSVMKSKPSGQPEKSRDFFGRFVYFRLPTNVRRFFKFFIFRGIFKGILMP